MSPEEWSYMQDSGIVEPDDDARDADCEACAALGCTCSWCRHGRLAVGDDRPMPDAPCRCGHAFEMHGVLVGEGGRTGCLSCGCRGFVAGGAA